MKVLGSLAAVAALFGLGLLGAGGTIAGAIFGLLVPYVAVAVLVGGLAWQVVCWACTPVPFCIPTTCGQQESLGWIKPARLENPRSTLGVVGRMALEVLLFRSLLRNTKARLADGPRLAYWTSPALWLAAMAFHWSLLVVLVRHLRLVMDPVPGIVATLAAADGLAAVGTPVVYASSCAFLAALGYLLVRRLLSPWLRYISLPGDYFLLILLLAIGASGFCVRHLSGADLVRIKQLAVGLAHFRPVLPGAISPWFYGHLFLVCVLAACIPFSKIVHLAGALLSPTRNLAGNSRRTRHVNPWNYPVKVHTYEEYEDELRGKMQAAGIPVEKP